MADTTAGLMLKISTLLLLSIVGAEKFRHFQELNHRFSYLDSKLNTHVYHTTNEDSEWIRHPRLFRLKNKVTRPKTTTTAVSAVIMLPWLPTTEDPFRADLNGILDDGLMPETTVKSMETLKSDIDNEWEAVDRKQTTVASTTPMTATSVLHHNHHHHHQHQSSTTVKTTSTHHHEPQMRLKATVDDSKAEEKKKIMEHIQRVKLKKCSQPQMKVIRVHDVYPHTSKSYNPHCTIIYQCDGDSGCCEDDRKVCTVKKSEQVWMSFFVLDGNNLTMERLEFQNHTECHCQFRKDNILRDSTTRPIKPTPAPSPPCQCPSSYSVRLLSDGTRRCDCFHLDKDCLKLKKGKAYFSAQDIRCIRNGTCLMPSCEYGQYLQRNGRCVQRKEMFSHWPKYTVQDIDS